ncbi:hypothetical protein [Myxococcus xanthus]|uniref:Restriction endonuclease n=1 Tax=Myxococcus xanthus TaxID=34 RepID=A0AAE6G367_MYXXA|nr:hypothetical protein [Myxococcus xanthus]QDE70168.1 hypothetical protein BHS09_26085 [Myxococcus xanthus]QDE77447.1 hypothetical protein BHS08_26110 [Myxococcus xanthus]QDE84841.1 hypothetical protein BHS07_26650 [Myxococcus xanthus]QDE98996.1 hypothetical protein BHS05_25925 [Myxococcus xanthus]
MASSLQEFLRQSGPTLSSHLCTLLQGQGIPAATARKRIERAPPEVQKIKNLRFPHNERFVYLKEQWNTEEFWQALLKALDDTGSVYGLALHALKARGGLVPRKHFSIICGSPEFLKKHVPAQGVLERGLDLRLFRLQTHARLGECVTFGERLPLPSIPLNAVRARRLTEDLLLNALKEWLRNLGLGSYESVKLRSDEAPAEEQPRFGQFRWDLTAPSYMHPLLTFDRRSKSGGNPGFIVADVVLGTTLTEQQVEVFLHKCEVMRYQRKTRPFLAFLIADHFERQAFALGRNRGLVLATPGAVLGEDVGTALQTLLSTLTHATDAVVQNPLVVIDLVNRLSKIEGAAGNLRGALFEMIIAHLVRVNEGNETQLGVGITDPTTGARAEIDVLRTKGSQEVAVYECKGKSPNTRVSREEVEKWLKISVPRIDAYLHAHPNHHACRVRKFEFWTSGTFVPEARQLLQQAKASTRKYQIDFRDGEGVLEYARDIRDTHFLELLSQHFLKHPLAQLEPVPSNNATAPSAPPPANAPQMPPPTAPVSSVALSNEVRAP